MGTQGMKTTLSQMFCKWPHWLEASIALLNSIIRTALNYSTAISSRGHPGMSCAVTFKPVGP